MAGPVAELRARPPQMTLETEAQPRVAGSFRESLRRLYHGHTPGAMRFQAAVIALDLLIIGFFIAAPVLDDWPSFLWIDYTVATLLGMDLAARALAARNVLRWLSQPTVWVDFFIFVTLLMPATHVNLTFLRILRLWSLSRSGFIWRPLDRRGLGRWRDPGHAMVNLITFLFIVTGFIYTFFFRSRAGLDGYVDALYFTVATITTTGFGDITLPGIGGKLTSIVVMIIGISLFVKFGQSIFRPHKVLFTCPKCALQRHDPDAVYCKACGHPLQIPDEGGWSS
jgi:voltage-gated potassium channel